MIMWRTGTALPRRLVFFGLTVAFIAVAMAGTGCGDDSEQSDRGAELHDFIRLGTLSLSREQTPPVELGTDAAAALAEALEASPGDEVHAALTQEPPAGTTGVGFVLLGCRETGARLNVSDTAITAELTGGENWNCEAPVYFLATFHISTEEIPEGAVLGAPA